MTISGVSHRVRTGLHANVATSRAGSSNLVSFIYNKEFNLFYTIGRLYRQTKTDRTGQTRQTYFNLASVVCLYFYLILIDLIIAGQLLYSLSAMKNPSNNVYFAHSPDFSYYINSLRILTNWAVILITLLNWRILILSTLIFS